LCYQNLCSCNSGIVNSQHTLLRAKVQVRLTLLLLPPCAILAAVPSHLQAKPATIDVNAAMKAVQDQKAAVQAAVNQAVAAKTAAVNGTAASVTKAINDKVASVSAAPAAAAASISVSASNGSRKMLL
jgi:hypothetical protein